MVARALREREVPGSSPGSPTINKPIAMAQRSNTSVCRAGWFAEFARQPLSRRSWPLHCHRIGWNASVITALVQHCRYRRRFTATRLSASPATRYRVSGYAGWQRGGQRIFGWLFEFGLANQIARRPGLSTRRETDAPALGTYCHRAKFVPAYRVVSWTPPATG